MNKYVVPNLSKALQILKLLSSADGGLSALELEQRLKMPRTTVFRILKTLLHEGMVEKRKTQYYAGAGLFEIGLHALRGAQLREMSVPVLQELTSRTGQTSHLAIPSGWHSLILEVCDSPYPLRVASRPGTMADLHCSATGKVFLAWLFGQRLAEFVSEFGPQARTARTLVTVEQLEAMTRQVRQAGYAVDDEEYHSGVRCAAAPVFNMEGVVVAAVGITGPLANLDSEQKMAEVCRAVLSAARRLSGALGYKAAEPVDRPGGSDWPNASRPHD